MSARRVIRAVPLAAFGLIAAAAFVQSFEALRDVAADVGAVAAHLAWLTPLLIDGTIVAASAVLWSRALDRQTHLAALGVVAGAGAVSIGANMLHADPSWIARGLAALPPVALLVSVELAMAEVRHRMRQPVPPAASALATAATEPRVDLAELPEPPGQVGPTERARRVLDAYVASDGALTADGLVAALAARADCSIRTAQRVLATHRAPAPAALQVDEEGGR